MSTEEFQAASRRVFDHYGVKAESRFVDLPSLGGQAHVIVAGEGPPLVMVNGAGTPAAMLAPLMAQLPDHRIYAIDLPGFGLTDPSAGYTADLRHNAVRLVTETLDALEFEQVSMLANSFGSLVALWVALDQPHRLAASIHVGCPALILDTSAPLPMRLLSTRLGPLLMKLDPPSSGQVRRLSKMVHQHPLDPAIAELLLATERLDGFEEALLGTYRQLIQLRGARPGMALSEKDLSQIEHPVQLIWGDDDPFGGPDVGRRVAAVLPDAELNIVPGGHAPWLHNAAEIGSLVQTFLQRFRSSTSHG